MLFLETLQNSATDLKRWEQCLEKCEHQTYCHTYGWRRVIEESYKLSTLYLIIKQDNKDVGLLPLVLQPSIVPYRYKAVSVSFCNSGGLLLHPGIDRLAAEKMCYDYLKSINVKHVELRCFTNLPNDYATLIKQLPKTVEDLWKQIKPRMRNYIRKAENNLLEVRWTDKKELDVFYNIYSNNMRQFGTPVHAKSFFSSILTVFADQAKLLLIYYKKQPVACMLVFKYRETWTALTIASLRDFLTYRSNYLLYWAALEAACDSGAAYFDFGRSPVNSGTYEFKMRWGGVPVFLEYRNFLSVNELTTSSIKHYQSSKLKFISYCWSFLPMWLHNLLGPYIRKYLP